jgi:NCS2 family nucleobase:cation symporter-2/xanthine permease XanP
MQGNQLKFDVSEQPSFFLTLSLALTHVLLIFDGIIFVPNVLGKTAGLDHNALRFITFATILVAALFTFLQSRRKSRIGAGFILFCGSYSAFLACSLDAVNMGGLPLLASMSLLTVPVIFLYTYFIRHFRHIITPAVGGVVVLLIAISLVPIGLDLWAGAPDTLPEVRFARLGVGGVTVLILTLLMLFGNGRLKLWSPILALLGGYGAALATGLLHFEHSAGAAWIGLPPLAWPGIETRITTLHTPLLLAFGMAMIASMIENTGNIMLVQQISKREFRRVSYDQVQAGLYGDGLSKVAAGLLGTAVPSIYCDNLPLIEITGAASRRIGTFGAAILLALAFMPKISGIILDMPGPVIGGLLIVIASMLFHAGIGLVTMNRLGNQHGIILGLALTVGLVAESGSYFPGVVPASLAPLLENSVAVGGFTAFFLSTLAYLAPKKSVQGSFRAVPGELAGVQEMIAAGQKRLAISDQEMMRLSLCCEEVFMHMAGPDAGPGEDEERRLTLRISRTEDGIFTEAACGHKMDDINNFAPPDSLLLARPEELQQLGLLLFSEFAREPKHVEISGYSYISFLL